MKRLCFIQICWNTHSLPPPLNWWWKRNQSWLRIVKFGVMEVKDYRFSSLTNIFFFFLKRRWTIGTSSRIHSSWFWSSCSLRLLWVAISKDWRSPSSLKKTPRMIVQCMVGRAGKTLFVFVCYTRKICIFRSKAIAIQSGWDELHWSWLISFSAE